MNHPTYGKALSQPEQPDHSEQVLDMVDWEAVAADQAMTIAMMQLEQEPVGHLYTIAGTQHCTIEKVLPDGPLYTSPPKREWVGLTDEEAIKLWDSTDNKDSWELIKRVEAKLKEKNG